MINRTAKVVRSPSHCASPGAAPQDQPRPDPDGDVVKFLAGGACTSSGDGLLLLAHIDLHFAAPVIAKQGAALLRQRPKTGHDPGVTRFVFNPLTRQLSRLAGVDVCNPVSDGLRGPDDMGILTQTAASHAPWAMMRFSPEVVGAPSVDVRLAEPPHVSEIRVPEHLVQARGSADPDSRVPFGVCAASDGLLLLTYQDLRFTPTKGAWRVRQIPADLDPGQVSSVTRFVCNPVTGELSRLPDSICSPLLDVACASQMGFITQADLGHGPPDRFAAATLLPGTGRLLLRFLSETEEWEVVEAEMSPFRGTLARPFKMNQEPLACGGRLWWVDVGWGAVSVDPFTDRPERSFVLLPRQSVLPKGVLYEGRISYRRVGVSEGRLRYVEVSHEKPFLLSSFVLDDEGRGWTLEHRVVLNKILARSTCMPLQRTGDADIVLIHPLDANVVYLMVMSQIVAVDMEREEVIQSFMCGWHNSCMPCVLPPWLGSSRVPSSGSNKGVEKTKTLADVLVRSDGY